MQGRVLCSPSVSDFRIHRAVCETLEQRRLLFYVPYIGVPYAPVDEGFEFQVPYDKGNSPNSSFMIDWGDGSPAEVPTDPYYANHVYDDDPDTQGYPVRGGAVELTPAGIISGVRVTQNDVGDIYAVVPGTELSGFGVAKYSSSGILETSFGTGGIVQVFLDGSDGSTVQIESIPTTAGGGFVIAKPDAGDYGQTILVSRFNAQGLLDTTYGNAGTASTTYPYYTSISSDGLLGLEVQSDGSVVLGSEVQVSPTLKLARLTPAGDVDTSFGTAGWMTAGNVFGYLLDSELFHVADDDAIWVGSLYTDPVSEQVGFLLTKRNSDGTFVSSAWVETDVFEISQLVVGADGKFYIGGSVNGITAIARFNSSGAVDTTFGNSGLMSSSYPEGSSMVGVVPMSDGSVGVAFEGVTSRMWRLHQVSGSTVADEIVGFDRRRVIGLADGGSGNPLVVENMTERLAFGHFSTIQQVMVNNVQPTATLTTNNEGPDGLFTVGLIDPSDPSGADVAAGFRYSFSTNYWDLAWSYEQAGTASSQSYEFETTGPHQIWARVFDKDGYHSDYNTTLTLPTLNIATDPSTSQVMMSWADIATGETGWRIQRSSDGSTWDWYHNVAANSTSYTDSSVVDGTRYWYRVRAYGTPGTTADTPYSPKKAANVELAAPDNVSLDADVSGATELRWRDNSNHENGYLIYQSIDGGTFAQIGSTSANVTTFALSAPTLTANYTYRIKAIDTDQSSNEAFGIVTRSSQISSAGPHVLASQLVTDSVGDKPRLVLTFDTGVTGLTADDLVLRNLTTGALVAVSVSLSGNTADVAILDGTGASQVLPDGNYQLTISRGAFSDTSGHSLSASFSSEFSFFLADANRDLHVDIADLKALTTNWLGTERSYSQGDFNFDGTVDTSDLGILSMRWSQNYQSLVPLSTEFINGTHVALDWAESGQGGWTVLRSTDGITFDVIRDNSNVVQSVLPQGSEHFEDRWAQPGQSYWYQVRAASDSGVSAIRYHPQKPTQPSHIWSTAISDTTMSVTWADNSSSEDGFIIERASTFGGAFAEIGVVPANVEVFTDSSLPSETATYYVYRVKSFNVSGESAAVHMTPTPPAVAIEGSPHQGPIYGTWAKLCAPSNVSVLFSPASTAVVSWTDNSGNESGHYIRWSGPTSGFAVVTGPATSLEVSGQFVVNGAYTFSVSAFGTYPWQNAESAPTNQTISVPGTFLNTPAALEISGTSYRGATLDWSPVTNATGYVVFRQAVGSHVWEPIGTTDGTTTEFEDTSALGGREYIYAAGATSDNTVSLKAESNPIFALDGNDDADSDGVSNWQEFLDGTHPLAWADSDGDFLPDEFDPNPTVPDDAYADTDGDGLGWVNELFAGTNPMSTDSDGDGVSDGSELLQGSDPTNSGDDGDPLPNDLRAAVKIRVGDESASSSERWAAHVGGHTLTAPLGSYTEAILQFPAGKSYPIQLRHLGGQNDFDWTLAATAPDGGAASPFFVTDYNSPQLLPGGFNAPSPPAGTAFLHAPLLDADVDSDNNNSPYYAMPVESLAEDLIEADSNTGKVVIASTGDEDGDGTVDTEDLSIRTSNGSFIGHFVPLIVRLSKNVWLSNPTSVKLKLTYDASAFRIWKKDAAASGRSNSDIIESGTEVEFSSLTGGSSVTLFIQALGPTSTFKTIQVAATVAATVGGTFVLQDQNNVTAVNPADLQVDSDRSGSITAADDANEDKWILDGPERTGAIILPNSDDDDGNDIPDNWVGGNLDHDTNDSVEDADVAVNGVADVADIGRFRVPMLGAAPLANNLEITLAISAPQAAAGSYWTDVPAKNRVRIFLPKKVSGNDKVMDETAVEIIGPTKGDTITFKIGAGDTNYNIFQGVGYIEFGVEGLQPGGDVTITLTTKIGNVVQGAPDSVAVRVSPLILFSHGALVDRGGAPTSVTGPSVIVVDGSQVPAGEQAVNNAELVQKLVAEYGDRVAKIPASDVWSGAGLAGNGDFWAQDPFEIGYAQAPYGQMHLILLTNRAREEVNNSGEGLWAAVARKSVMRNGVGILDFQSGAQTGKSDGGNIEVMAAANGLGTIVIGDTPNLHADELLVKFLKSQGVQQVRNDIDLSRLDVGHIDEVISFSSNGRTRHLMASPDVAGALLVIAQKQGIGATNIFQGIRSQAGISPDALLNPQNPSRQYNFDQTSGMSEAMSAIKQQLGLHSPITSAPTSGAGTPVNALKRVTYLEMFDALYQGGDEIEWELSFTNGTTFTLRHRKFGTANWSNDGQGQPGQDFVSDSRVVFIAKEWWNTVAGFADGNTITFRTKPSQDVIDIPVWFRGGGERAVSFSPNAVNSLIDGDKIILAQMFGPKAWPDANGVPNSVDIFQHYIRKAAETAGFTSVIVSDERYYASNSGSIHCATNVLRLIPHENGNLWWNLNIQQT